MWNEVQETVKFLKNKGITTPDDEIILGTGLGNLVEKITIEIAIPYAEIPNFPVSTVEGHSGELIFGVLGGKKVLAAVSVDGYVKQILSIPGSDVRQPSWGPFMDQ